MNTPKDFSKTNPRFKLINQFTALGLFRRFYLNSCLIQANPLSVIKTSVILATKIEEINVDMVKVMNELDIKKEEFIKTEFKILESLKYLWENFMKLFDAQNRLEIENCIKEFKKRYEEYHFFTDEEMNAQMKNLEGLNKLIFNLKKGGQNGHKYNNQKRNA